MRKLNLLEKYLICVCGFLFSILVFGGHLQKVIASTGQNEIFKELEIFTDVLAIVQSDYVKSPESSELVKGAIKGMLSTLDPHSGYLDPSSYDELESQTKGHFGGLGIEITMRDGLLVVVAPMEDSPAAKAGIEVGDAIVKIEGKFTKNYTLMDAVSKLRGPRGSAVTISVQREGETGLREITIIRDIIKIKSVKKRFLGNGYAYLRITQFMDGTSDDIAKALTQLKRENKDRELKGAIIDVRNNPGGLLAEAIRVSDIFLKEGVIVYTEGRLNDQKQKFYARDTEDEPNYPLIVLINGGSASASEILAGALKDHGRALILGTQSFGKGSVQTVHPLHNGGALTLTTALYFTKSGNSIQAKGVSPDIEIEAKVKSESETNKSKPKSVRESELPGAIANPDGDDDPKTQLEKINKTPKPSASKYIDPETVEISEWLERDAQFQRAYDLLKTFNIFKS